MLASSFLDPVLGLDVHFEMVPTPAPVPTPIPNPFIGIVFDPLGLAAGIAIGAAIGAVVGAPFQGPVLYWTAFPATNTGTEAKHVPGHILIPPGTMWAPFPKTPKPVIHPGETPSPGLPVKPENDAVVVFGSKTVTVMGSNAVRLGDIALSCSEPLRLPSSVVLAVPKGAPILIGGPMSLDIMDPADHKRTASNGSMPNSEAYRQAQKDLLDQARAARDAGDMPRARSLVDDAIQMDIDDVTKQFGNKYDDAIMEMVDSLDDDFYDRITKDKKPCP